MHLADKAGCYSLCTALDKRFLGKQTHHIKDMADLLQQTVRVSKHAGHGIFHLDRELHRAKGNLPWGKINDPDSIALEIDSISSQLDKVEV
jgi:ferritin heavy chain